MNQPESLKRVKALRLRLDELRQEVEESQAVSARADQQLVRTSFWLWGGMTAGLLLILLAAFS